jgi:HSP20 family protein
MTSDFISSFEKRMNPLFGHESMDDFVHRELLPLTHFNEKNSKWILEVDLPGVKKNDVEVTLTREYIVIKAKLKESYCVSSHDHITKFEYFKKVMILPSYVNIKKITAKFNNGILTIIMPKITTGKKIPIK